MIKEVSPEDEDEDNMATHRPRKRLKRLGSPGHAELADDLEDDLEDESLEDDEDEDFGEIPHSFSCIMERDVWVPTWPQDLMPFFQACIFSYIPSICLGYSLRSRLCSCEAGSASV